MYARFFGGSHPTGHKETTRRKRAVPPDVPPKEVRLPLLGCEPLVKQGDLVKLGQCVARPAVEDGAALHASVSGVVAGVTETAVVIRNDGKDTAADCSPWSGPEPLDACRLAELLRSAGVVGMASGDGGSVHKKLIAAAAAPVDTLIINGTECDPWHTADHRLMLAAPRSVAAGARVLMEALKVKTAVIAVAGDKLDAAAALEEAAEGAPLAVKVLRSRYPMGEERILTGLVTGRRVPLGGNPLAVGCVVFNVHTAAAVGEAVLSGRPVTHRIVTVTGTAVVKPRNLLVPIGMPIAELTASTDGLRPGLSRCFLGGPMRGKPLADEAAVVEKSTAAVVVLRIAGEPQRGRGRGICIRCGDCASACPMGLLPLYARTGDEGPRAACVNCGACSAVCPAGLPLREWMSRKGGAR